MSGTPVVTLGGVVLGGSEDYSWEFSYGTARPEQVFVVSADRAAQIPLGVPLTFEITNVPRPLKAEHLYAIEIGAGPSPNQRTVKITDRRWLWEREWFSCELNVRRASGDSTLVTEAGQPVELAQIDPTIRYAKWSLDPPEAGAIKWGAKRWLEHTFLTLNQPYRIEGQLPPESEIVGEPVEGNGNAAVEKALSFLPGADVYIDGAGVAVVQDVTRPLDQGGTRERGTGQVVHPALARKHVDIGGDTVTVSRRAIRPSKVCVYFTPEVEVRFDTVSEGGTSVEDTPELVNVAPSPDVTLTLSDGTQVARGSYVPLETLMSTWGGVFGKDENQSLSMTVLAQFGTSAGLLEAIYTRADGGIYSPVKGARVLAALRSWRRLYQVDARFVQRLSSIRASRVAIVNPLRGTRARSEVYCDYSRRPNRKNPEAKGDIEGFTYGWFTRGYAARLADAHVAPAIVSVVSETAGIIRIEPQLDPWGKADAVLLGYPRDGTLPTNTGDAAANRTGLDTLSQWSQCQLATDFRAATVLTVIPASPNTLGRLHKVEIEASAAGHDGDGPVLHVRVFPELMSARFAWNDDQAGPIKDSILRGDPRPEGLMVNKKDVDAVALAAAKTIYAGMVDGPDTTSGPVSVDMDPSLMPVGAIGRVRHGLNGGITTTRATATGFRVAARMWRFLPADVQKTILRSGNEVES